MHVRRSRAGDTDAGLLRACFRVKRPNRKVLELDTPPYGTAAGEPAPLDLVLYNMTRETNTHADTDTADGAAAGNSTCTW